MLVAHKKQLSMSHSCCIRLGSICRCQDAYKSDRSLIILDNLERLLGENARALVLCREHSDVAFFLAACGSVSEYSPVGPRYSNSVLQTLSVLLKKLPEHEVCFLQRHYFTCLMVVVVLCWLICLGAIYLPTH
jgi:hypothetical protein